MIDIGVNLIPAFSTDLDKEQNLWIEAGVDGVIAIASDLDEAQQLIGLCNNQKNIWQTIGCHPHHADSWTTSSSRRLKTLLETANSCIAIGETGLDYNRNYSSKENQIRAFVDQIQLSLELQLPLYLHERDAELELQSILTNQAGQEVHGVIHCFTGSKESLKRYLDLGLYVGITGWICDERRGQDLQDAIKYIPHDRILIETDAPYLLPRSLRPRPKSNHPQYLPHIAQQAAAYANMSTEKLMSLCLQNSKRLFALNK